VEHLPVGGPEESERRHMQKPPGVLQHARW